MPAESFRRDCVNGLRLSPAGKRLGLPTQHLRSQISSVWNLVNVIYWLIDEKASAILNGGEKFLCISSEANII